MTARKPIGWGNWPDPNNNSRRLVGAFFSVEHSTEPHMCAAMDEMKMRWEDFDRLTADNAKLRKALLAAKPSVMIRSREAEIEDPEIYYDLRPIIKLINEALSDTE